MRGGTWQLGRVGAAPLAVPATARDCALLLALAGAVRLLWLGHQPLWTDELFSFYWSQLDPGFLLGDGARLETNPPAYYLLLRGWMETFGASAFDMRLPSALFSAATVPVVYAIGRVLLLDRPTALLAGAFAALSPVAVPFAQEARAYALLMLCESLALLALAGYARRAANGARSWPWLALFVLAAIGGFLSHYTALLLIAASLGAVALWLLTLRPFPIREALVWISVGLLIGAAVAAPLRTAMSLSSSANIAWIPFPSALTVLGFCLDLLIHPSVPITGGMLPIFGLFLLTVAAALPCLRLDRLQFGVLVLIPMLFILLIFGVSVWRPLLTPNVAIWLTTPLSLILARAATAQRLPRTRALVAGVVTLYCMAGLGNYYAFADVEDWPAGLRLVTTEPRCAGPILVAAGKGLGLAYYGPPPSGRPVHAFALTEAEQRTALFLLNQRVTHSGILDAGAVAGFVRTRPGTVVLIAATEVADAPAPLKAVLETAPYHALVSRSLHAFCF